MTREEAIKKVQQMSLPKETMDILEALAPELKESEDERIINQLITIVNSTGEVLLIPTNKEELISWLNKCKESLHISETCKENPDSFTDEDERIRKALIEALTISKSIGELKFRLPEPTREECIAWLEKQKERNPINQCNTHEPTLDEARKWNEAYEKGYSLGYENGRNEQKPAEWKPQPESLEALMYAIEGKWEMIKPTSYLSRRLEDLYGGLVNTYNVDETFLAELPKTAYTAEDIEELKALKDKIDASMDEKPAEWSEEDDWKRKELIQYLEEKGDYRTVWMTWLKSLRPSWKPTKNQLDALNYVIMDYVEDGCTATANYLQEISAEIKKL